MGLTIYAAFLAGLVHLTLFGVASVVIAAMRWTLLIVFSGLPNRGVMRICRQAVSFPVVALLSRERRARNGENRSIREVMLLQSLIAGTLSWFVQGHLVALVGTGLLSAGIFLAFHD